MFSENISKEELDILPLHFFEGKIDLIDSQRGLQQAVAYLRAQPVIGFDTETKPAFRRGEYHKVALLQLSTHDRAFLFRINRMGLDESVRGILSDPKIVKVGVAIRDDIKGLQKIKPFKPEGFVELQDFVKRFGIQDFSLKKLSGIVLGSRISKAQRLTNWEADELSEAQQVYAATDAWVSFEIYHALNQ